MLSQLAGVGVNLLAFTAIPVGPMHMQLTIFPEDVPKMANESKMAGLVLDGPHPALLVQGDDRLGAIAEIHASLPRAEVDVYASSGVNDGRGGFGYVLYVKPDEYERAVAALGV